MPECVLAGAAEIYGDPRMAGEAFVIAADGGYEGLLRLGIVPDLLIGDLDSLVAVPSGIEILKHPVRKDETDMHLAFLEGYRRGYRSFWIFGGTGGRLDHTLANISLMISAKDKGAECTLFGDGFRAYVLHNEKRTLKGKKGGSVSIFAVNGEASGVSVRGLEYEAENITLREAFALGVSNAFRDGDGEVEVASGYLLVIEEV